MTLGFIEKYQWMYAVITGYCITALLVILGITPDRMSHLLYFATTLFAICLPIYATMSVTYWIFLKFKVPEKNVALLINNPKHQRFTITALFLIGLATLAIIMDFNLWIGMSSLASLVIGKLFQSYCLNEVGIDSQWLDAVEKNPGNSPEMKPRSEHNK